MFPVVEAEEPLMAFRKPLPTQPVDHTVTKSSPASRVVESRERSPYASPV